MTLSIDEIKQIISSDSDMAEKLSALPLNLQFKDIHEFLGYCEPTVYKLIHLPSFPYLNTGVTKILVPRPLFLHWYFSNCIYNTKITI